MSSEDRTTNESTNALWARFSNFVLGGEDGLTAMNKAVELEGWVKPRPITTTEELDAPEATK